MDIFDISLSTFLTGFITLLGVVVITNYWMLLQRRKGLPPGPVSLPFVGTVYMMPRDMSQLPFVIANLSKKYGNVFSLQLPNGRCSVIITDPQISKETFVKDTAAAGRPFNSLRKTSQQIINPFFPKSGIVFGDYDEQLKLQRNIAMVVLRNLGYGKKSLENKILEEADHLVSALMKYQGVAFSPKHLIDSAVANIICSLLFGDRFSYDDKEFLRLQKITEESFEHLMKSIPLDLVWIYKYLPSGKRQLSEFRELAREFNDVVSKKINEVKKNMANNGECTDFISLYLKEVKDSAGKLEDRSHQLVKDFFGAGAETTSTTLGWLIYFMAKYPDVQEKVHQELHRVLKEGEKPTLKDRQNLPYIEATILETLRTAPTAPGSLPHMAIIDTMVGGYKVPKGTQVQSLFGSTVWDPVLFPDPHVLKPERHLDEQGNFVKNENLTPFGVGRRSCLGEQLARQELFLFFTHLIQSFRFEVPEGEPLPPQRGSTFITYRPPFYKITVIPRN